jgi:hypothetical protein
VPISAAVGIILPAIASLPLQSQALLTARVESPYQDPYVPVNRGGLALAGCSRWWRGWPERPC